MINIEPKFLGVCDECEFIDPVINVEKAYANDKIHMVGICVTCKDYEKCRRMHRIFKERYR